ncbi:MAG TPA: cytochrome c3 family protein [Pirellulales bacterium]|nr:cytochrome c3 family protein [Pirellulales bacterium]
MPQVFPRRANAISRLLIVGTLLGGPALGWFSLTFTRSSYGTDSGIMREQPIPFSHEHHVGVLGIDCRYCHTSVERSSLAGMPATKICMNCHSQMWVGSEMLKPVRDSYRKDVPLAWRRVYNLPGFVYFDHSIHVHSGIGCSSCHGRIDEMAFTYQKPSLLMEWCLDCHRHPERQIRPREEVFNIRYVPPADQELLGAALCEQYGIKDALTITSCSVCHR